MVLKASGLERHYVHVNVSSPLHRHPCSLPASLAPAPVPSPSLVLALALGPDEFQPHLESALIYAHCASGAGLCYVQILYLYLLALLPLPLSLFCIVTQSVAYCDCLPPGGCHPRCLPATSSSILLLDVIAHQQGIIRRAHAYPLG